MAELIRLKAYTQPKGCILDGVVAKQGLNFLIRVRSGKQDRTLECLGSAGALQTC